VRERLALTDGRAEALLRELRADPSIHEAVAISTCNRTELYLVVGDPVQAESAVLGVLARQAGTRPTELVGSIYSLRNCEVARHLYRVTAGLESMIVGEAEVQGQVSRAYELALGQRATGPLTNRLFRAALATGKRVRSETGLSAGRTSVASVAVDLAREAVGPLERRRALVIGAGETSEATARALHDHGVATIFVANRRRERARALAERFGGQVASFDALPSELEQVDIVVASTGSPHTILHAEELALVMQARGGRPLLLVDIAVPRDIDPAAGELPGLRLYDIDDLQARVARNRSVRTGEAVRAEAIVDEELRSFAAWLGSLEVLPTVAALREHGDAIAEQVLAENAGRWENLSERDLERVRAVARATVNRLLHEPTVRLKGMGADRRHARMQLLRELFGLEQAPAPEQRPGEPGEVHPLPLPRARRGG